MFGIILFGAGRDIVYDMNNFSLKTRYEWGPKMRLGGIWGVAFLTYFLEPFTPSAKKLEPFSNKTSNPFRIKIDTFLKPLWRNGPKKKQTALFCRAVEASIF